MTQKEGFVWLLRRHLWKFCSFCRRTVWPFTISATFFEQIVDSCLFVSDNDKHKSWLWNKFGLLVATLTVTDGWAWWQTVSCFSLLHQNVKKKQQQKTPNMMVIVSSFHFNIHLTISLADKEGKERGSIKSRKTEKHSFANTQASCDHGSEKGTVFAELSIHNE